jgi:hypothetical protein
VTRDGERPQPGVDEAGGAANVGGHLLVEQRRGGRVLQVPAQAVGLHAPQSEQRPGGDLRLGVVGGHSRPRGQDRGSCRGGLVGHVGLIGAQRGGGADQVAESPDRLATLGGATLGGEPAGHGLQLLAEHP